MAKSTPPKTLAAEPVAKKPMASDVHPSGRDRNEQVDTSPAVTSKVYIHAFSSGPRASLEAVPLHEVPLMRRKLETFGESLTLSTDWPDFVPRDRVISALQFREEHARMSEKYSFVGNDGKPYDLVQDMYGPVHQGRLIAVMRKQFKAWQVAQKAAGDHPLSLEVINTLVQIADPEADYIETDLIEAKV